MNPATNLLLSVLLMLMVGFNVSCSGDDSYDETLIVASETVTTSEGIAYWVKRNGNPNWEIEYTGIFNFDYKKGYEYKIKVRYYKNDDVGPDQSSYRCYLLQMISKEKKDSDIPFVTMGNP